MKKMALGLIASILLLTGISLAQMAPQAPASWVAFQKEESAKRVAFNKQMHDEAESFLSSHPEVKAYLNEKSAATKARFEAWKAAHQK